MSAWECRVGHRYSPEGLIDAQAVNIEAALWSAIRALEDRSRILERMAGDAEQRGMRRSAKSFKHGAQAASEQARVVREALRRASELNLLKIDHDEPNALAAGGASQ